ncbi:MAG TPA: S41 family peptidase [Steroidobacteraceae bacterium]|nr:S41 family peptidase [Steroidobacteraceae bacterium]
MVTRFIRLLIAACTLAPFGPVNADTREVVREMAALIENNYFDPDKANEIARELRAAERAGAFAKHADPRDLAVALTARLKASDRHFNVVWVPAPASRPTLGADEVSGAGPFIGRSSGIRSVAMLAGSVGYIDMRSLPYISFRESNDPARLAADSALQLVSGAAAVILDLRYAIGGYPEMAGYIVSAFTAPDADIYNVFHGRGERESERPKQLYHSPKVDVPLYVLVSGSTASAAESTAYTLQAAKRAIIVGERTSGAANPGGMLPVGDGFNVFISNSTPINPITGTNWEGNGVQPDIAMPVEGALERVHILALQHVLKERQTSAPREVHWALEYLTTKGQPQAATALEEYLGSYADAIVSTTDGALSVRRQRHPALRLRQLRGDTYMVVDEPSLRVVFERGRGNAVSGFQVLRASGYSIWHPRQ